MDIQGSLEQGRKHLRPSEAGRSGCPAINSIWSDLLLGYRLTNERAIRAIHKWKGVSNSNIVMVFDAFTNRSFGDSSLIVVSDYHPLSRTLAEAHFPAARYPLGSNNASLPNHRGPASPPTEPMLWGYTLQIAHALHTVHAAGLAARCLDPSKVLLTSHNRIRLGACGVLDIVQHDGATAPHMLLDLQRDDLLQFGRLLLAVGVATPALFSHAHTASLPKALELFARSYSTSLQERVRWLLNAGTAATTTSIEPFLTSLQPQLLAGFDAGQHLADRLTVELNRTLENGRVARLMMKLMFITERPDHGHDRQWAETGERFPIKLFRDYVFHQVDAQGAPALDMGHVLACLNKLDAGSEEKMILTSRDEQVVIVVSYREMKRAIDGAVADLMKAGRRAPTGM